MKFSKLMMLGERRTCNHSHTFARGAEKKEVVRSQSAWHRCEANPNAFFSLWNKSWHNAARHKRIRYQMERQWQQHHQKRYLLACIIVYLIFNEKEKEKPHKIC